MRTTRESQGRWRVSGQRIGVYFLVTGLHIGLVMSVLEEPPSSKPRPFSRAASARDTIRIRFLRHEVMVLAPPPPAPPILPRPPSGRFTGDASARSAVMNRSKTPPTNHPPEPTEGNAISADTLPTYIAGGGRFSGTSGDFRSGRVHLPGSSQPIVRNLHMIDPRMRGIGGVVRSLQTVFGVPDPHCINVEGWRGMSVRELLDRHMSPDQVEETATEYHCGPPV